MSENPPVTTRPELAGPPPPPHKSEGETPPVFRDRHASTSKPPRRPEEVRGRDTTKSEEVRQLQKVIKDLEKRLERREAEMTRLRKEEEKLLARCKRRDDRITKAERETVQMRRSFQEDAQKRTKEIQALEERLKKTDELLASRSAELSETNTFLSTTDRLSEVEVLSIVRDLNEHIYQVAVGLTEGLEKLEPPRATTSRMDVDLIPRSHTSAVAQPVRNRDLTGLTFQLQSYLCSQAARMTSGWGRHHQLAILEPIYRRLSTSEGQAISARWRSLTHSHLSQPSPDPTSLLEELSSILNKTGLFSSIQHSFKFARTVGLEGIESTIRLSQRLELAFMVEVTSSDMSLLFEAPNTVFDEKRMTNELGSSDWSSPRKRDKIVGTTEVGVGKSICEGAGKGRRTEILLKPKVVLEKDIIRL